MTPTAIGSKQLICISDRIQPPSDMSLAIAEARKRMAHAVHDVRFAARTLMAFLN